MTVGPEETARRWFVALLDAPDPATRLACEVWRAADPENERAFRPVEAGWDAGGEAAGRLAAAEAAALGAYLAAMDADRPRRRRRGAVAGAALLAVLAGGLWLTQPNLLSNLAADATSARGERRIVALPDGSTALLDADSALALDFETGRAVHLLRGGASFDVVPSPSRFTVEAAGGEIRVLGTRFDVHLAGDGAVVVLERGRVEVAAGDDAAVLAPGEQARFDREGVDPAKPVPLADALAWRDGRFAFYRMALADVVAEIGRYRGGRIVIVGDALAAAPVTGSFALADTDAALDALQASLGFRLIRLGPLTVIRP